MMRKFLVTVLLGLLGFSGWSQDAGQLIRTINTPYDEQNPVLTPDGARLYFTVRNHPLNLDGKRDPGDIWYADRVNGDWSEPIHAGSMLNDRSYNAVAGFSADGNQMYLLSHYDDRGPARTQGIAVSRRQGGGWSKPQNIFIPYFQNKSSVLSGYISSDEKVFVYSAETYGSYGVDDLYIVLKGADGKWQEPRNLGQPINTQFQELAPSLSEDGMTLYFSSNGRKGLGSFDVYSSSRLDDTFLNWSEPVNLGTTVNSDGRELYYRSFSAQGLTLFTSTHNSDGYGDIRLIINADKPDSMVIVRVEESPVHEPIKESPPDGFTVYGKIVNSRTGEPIQAKLLFESVDTTVTVIASPAGYRTGIKLGTEYVVEVESPGFVSRLEKIDLSGLEMASLEMNYNLQPVEVGTTVNLKNVLFVQSKPELLPESFKELDLVVTFMKNNPHVEIELAGHTDNRGSFRQLMSLSQERVNRVKEYLVSRGIEKKRISGRGYGGTKPIASNDTEEQRQLNRRVEFIIKKM